MPQNDESMYKGRQKFSKEQLTFMVQAILQGALDRVETGSPIWIDWEDRLDQANRYDNKPKELTAFERGAVEAAGMSLSLIAGQLASQPLCIQDALSMAGKFDKKVAAFVRACWDDKGAGVRQRIKSMAGRRQDAEKVLPEYPDCQKAAQKFVAKVFGGESGDTSD